MAQRRCLKCDKMFESQSPSNRICSPCKQLKHLPGESGPVTMNRQLKKVLKDKNIKFDRWKGPK